MTGILGGLIGSYPSGVSELTYISSGVGLASATIPATAQIGDLAILITSAHGTAIAKVFPADFTEVREDHDVDDSRMVTGYKILTSGDPGSSRTGMNDTEEHIGIMIFRPNRPIKNVTVSSINGEAVIGNPIAQTITMSGVNTPLIGLSFMSSSGIVSPRTYSPAIMTEQTISTTDAYMAYTIFNKGSTPVNVSVDMDDEGDNVMQSWVISAS